MGLCFLLEIRIPWPTSVLIHCASRSGATAPHDGSANMNWPRVGHEQVTLPVVMPIRLRDKLIWVEPFFLRRGDVAERSALNDKIYFSDFLLRQMPQCLDFLEIKYC